MLLNVAEVPCWASCLAKLWDSTWEAGAGDGRELDSAPVAEKTLIALYQDEGFLPSSTLETVESRFDGSRGSPIAGGGDGGGDDVRPPEPSRRRVGRRRAGR